MLKKGLKTHAKAHFKALKLWYASTFRSFTPEDIERTLDRLGIARGDAILVHSAFDAFSGFLGKPSEVLSVLQSCVGPEGLLMMPTMAFSGTAVDHARTNPTFDVARTPSRMGLLSELFRRSPGVVRSVHPTHPVAIWGHDATGIATGHHMAKTPCGVGSPFEALRERQGKIVLLGTDIGVLTFYHYLEEVMERDLPVRPFTDEVFHLRSKANQGVIFETHGRLFEPAVSKRRNLQAMVPYLKRSGAWREARLGGLKLTVLATADIEAVVRTMNEMGIYCYD